MATRAEARRRKILENSEDRLKRLTGRLENDSDQIPEQEKKPSRAEVRRRKILENSDERLKRFTGRLGSECDNGETLEKGEKNSNEQEVYDEKADNSKDLSQSTEAQQHSQNIHGISRTLKGDGDIHGHQSLNRDQTRGVKESVGDIKSPASDSPTELRSRRAPVSSKPDSAADGGTQSSPGHPAESSDSADIIRQIEITRLISCVLVAMLSRWFLPTLLGYLVLQSSALLFIAMEAALFTHQRHILQTVVLPHKNNLMAGALLLCGIKPELITTYNRVMGIASTLFEDLMVYFFTFITCHLLLS